MINFVFLLSSPPVHCTKIHHHDHTRLSNMIINPNSTPLCFFSHIFDLGPIQQPRGFPAKQCGPDMTLVTQRWLQCGAFKGKLTTNVTCQILVIGSSTHNPPYCVQYMLICVCTACVAMVTCSCIPTNCPHSEVHTYLSL